jgi:DNA-binding protein H-NS
MPLKLDSLNDLKDEELQAAIEHAETLLKQHDDDRKAKAMEQARTLLASVGLSLKDLRRKSPAAKLKGPVYHSGRQYQHPTNKALVWTGKGKKPGWLTALEMEGKVAVEAIPANDNTPLPVKKTA